MMELFLKAYGNIGGGYLGKLVDVYKKGIIDDLKNLPLMNLKVSLEKAPPGYVDDPAWNKESVLRLVNILQSSPNTPPSLRRMMEELPLPAPSRRFYFGFKEFPSLSKHLKQDFYYDIVEPTVSTDVIDLSGETTTYKPPNDSDVVYISNPVEARLPSAHITIGLLKEILLSRAEAARFMHTTKQRYTWKYGNATTPSANANTTSAGSGNSTLAGDNKSPDKTNGTNVTTGGDKAADPGANKAADPSAANPADTSTVPPARRSKT